MYDVPRRRAFRGYRPVRRPSVDRGRDRPGTDPVRLAQREQEYRAGSLAREDVAPEHSANGRQAVRGPGRPAPTKPADLFSGLGRIRAIRLSEFRPDPADGTGYQHGVPVFDAKPPATNAGRARI